MIPGFECGLVECANGSLASDGKDWVLFFAESCDRFEPLTCEVDILVTVARVAASEDGWVKVWTAMTVMLVRRKAAR